jgi:phosphatidylserine/phosphatidylglycerophosphate/cardiolipin synthase-like enzyme
MQLKDYQTRLYILADELKDYIESEEIYGKDLILTELKKVFPNLENEDLLKLIELFKLQNRQFNNEVISAEFVTTLPSQLQSIEARKTVGVLREYIHAAEQTILITGYSISEFAKDLILLLKRKSSEGIEIKFFIDRRVDEKIIKSLVGSSSKFKTYKLKESNLYSNLHAKIAVFDSKHAFISSSNLSYNGIINNIEVGSILHGGKVAELEQLFEEMLLAGYFKLVE